MLSPHETGRKIVHLLFGIMVVMLVSLRFLDLTGMAAILFISILISVVSKRMKLPLVSWFLENFERNEAVKNFPGKGAIYFFAGAALALLFFERNAALASIAILVLGDSTAPLIGQFGRIKNPFSPKKFVEGTIAGALMALTGASFFVKPLEALVASVCAMIVEGLDIKAFREKLDDNLVIPLVAGAVITAMKFFGI